MAASRMVAGAMNTSIPERFRESIDLYVSDRIPPGGFLTAVLSNNLTEAFYRADDEAIAHMLGIVSYCYNDIPRTSWGSPTRVREWLQGTR